MQLGTGTHILFDLLIQFIAGHSCIRNNIVNIPAPTLAEYKYLSLSRQHIESTKIHLVESVIIQKNRVTTDLPAVIIHLHNSN